MIMMSCKVTLCFPVQVTVSMMSPNVTPSCSFSVKNHTSDSDDDLPFTVLVHKAEDLVTHVYSVDLAGVTSDKASVVISNGGILITFNIWKS